MRHRHLINYTHDGVLFYKQVMERLAHLDKSLNALCNETILPNGKHLAFSTTWRWKNEGSKPEPDTANALEKVLRKWERKKRDHDASLESSDHAECGHVGV